MWRQAFFVPFSVRTASCADILCKYCADKRERNAVRSPHLRESVTMKVFRKNTVRWIIDGKRVSPNTKGAVKETIASKRWYGTVCTADGRRVNDG